jgi:23S rRNA (pseudouridine1915-N3)-methyltransferase
VKFRIVAVGKPKAGPVAEAIAEYERRAARYWPLEISEVRAEPGGSLDPAVVRRREAERLLARASGVRVACDERGTGMSSRAFATWLTELQARAGDVSFLLGGAHGLDQSVRESVARSLALAPWTLSHELARLVLAEQFYRAGTIRRGEPYHR